MIIGYKDAIDKKLIKRLSDTILCLQETQKMIVGYKDAIDKKFIKRLSDSMLQISRNSEMWLSDFRLALMKSS